MKLTQQQIERFNEQQKILKREIDIYKHGVYYPERFNKKPECSRVYWLEELDKAINDINLEAGLICNVKIEKISDVQYGWYIARYIASIENAVISEFGCLILPMDSIITKYGVAVHDILIDMN